ncbi:BTAD domain-containing putative transcriptional regulator [Umezawaea endophytica]|uniref:Tetratricopeptide repeat protein n=1 Tax=Umezawaea endophytica TaxID=1654476 RepID=A0A9X2VFY6_9PSEU|nr:BTAD domain-containing putative transcriptional regulator [Umezawaea endophytica]MCS7475737.1 tetratricopeptide repeat protein [Umezawaea endophytica]
MRYRLLGPVAVLGAADAARPGGEKQTSVLAALLLSPNRVVPEDRLIDVTWGEHAPRSVRGRLQVLVSDLRKLLGPDAIIRRSSGYVLEVAPGERDLDVFEETAARARATGGPAAVELFRAALDLWEGTPLGGVSPELAEQERPALHERRLVVLEELYELELAVGGHARITGELRRDVDANPYRERLRAALVLALHRCGRTPEALEAYDQAHERLVDELGIEPGKPLRDLRQRILRGEDEPPVPAPPAPQPPAPRPAELPLDVRGFAGRSAELAELDGPGDVWVVTGSPGVGKTALAVRWAHASRDRFPDGQLYVDLRGFHAHDEPLTPAAALAQLLRTLGVDMRDVPLGQDDQSGLYRSLLADRKALVVLDNARDAEQVLPLLPSSGRVLVTSRHRLGELVARTGARSLTLAQLPERDSHALLTAVVGGDRVAAEPEAAAELAALCGHHPLALRIAAANIGETTSFAAAVAELRGDPLGELALDGAEESAVTAAFSVSYRALTPDQRRAFRLLALVPGPDFTSYATAALMDVPPAEATRRLRGLAAANLVEARTPGRFRFHDLVRRYAGERVRTEEDEVTRAAAWERLFGCYLAATDAAVALLGARIVSLPRDGSPAPDSPVRFADAAEAVAWLDVEVPNLSAALRHAAAHGPHPWAWYLTDSLRRFFHDHGRRAEWLELAPVVLDAAVRRGARSAAALVHLSIGGAYFREGRHEEGVHHSTEAVLASRACGWRECEATAVANLGSMLEWTGRLTEAVEHSSRAIELFRELGNRSGENLALNSLSCHYRQLGRLAEAEERLGEAIALCRGEELGFWEAANLADLGSVLLGTGRAAEAELTLLRALESFGALGSRFGQATALNGLSALHEAGGRYGAAGDAAEEALGFARQDGDRPVEVGALIALGRARQGLGDLAAAEDHLRSAWETATRSGLRVHLADASAALARVLAATGRVVEADEHARGALESARAGGYRLLEAEALMSASAVEIAAGRPARAEDAVREALRIWQATGHVTGAARATRSLEDLAARAPR